MAATGEKRSTFYLSQNISIAFMRGNGKGNEILLLVASPLVINFITFTTRNKFHYLYS